MVNNAIKLTIKLPGNYVLWLLKTERLIEKKGEQILWREITLLAIYNYGLGSSGIPRYSKVLIEMIFTEKHAVEILFSFEEK